MVAKISFDIFKTPLITCVFIRGVGSAALDTLFHAKIKMSPQ